MTDVDVAPEPSDVDRPGRPGRRVAPLIVGAIALVMAALFVLLIRAQPDGGASADSALLGQPAPAATGEFADGTTFELSRRKGSWVVLNFFTHNCVPCIREHPDLIEFVEQQRALGTDGAEFYSIVRDSTVEETEAFFAERGGDWPVVYDTEFEFVNQFGVPLVPETWVIDPNGVVRTRIISEVDAEQLSTLMQRLREGRA